MDRFFVEEIQDAEGKRIGFGVMDRANPDDIIADFDDRAEAETEAGLCNECPDDADIEVRLLIMEAGL